MKVRQWFFMVLACFGFGTAFAEGNVLPVGYWGPYAVPRAELLKLAAVDPPAQSMLSELSAENTDKPEFKTRLFTRNTVHKYLGIGSIAMAAGTLLAPKEEGGLHETLGKGAAALGVAAVVTGFLFHWEDIDLRAGYKDPDNLHMVLTTVGTLGFLSAVSDAPAAHGGAGGIGAISMALGIKMTW